MLHPIPLVENVLKPDVRWFWSHRNSNAVCGTANNSYSSRLSKREKHERKDIHSEERSIQIVEDVQEDRIVHAVLVCLVEEDKKAKNLSGKRTTRLQAFKKVHRCPLICITPLLILISYVPRSAATQSLLSQMCQSLVCQTFLLGTQTQHLPRPSQVLWSRHFIIQPFEFLRDRYSLVDKILIALRFKGSGSIHSRTDLTEITPKPLIRMFSKMCIGWLNWKITLSLALQVCNQKNGLDRS